MGVALVNPLKETTHVTSWRQPCSTCSAPSKATLFPEYAAEFQALVRFHA